MPSYSKISSRCKTCRSIGIGGRRALDVHYSGLRALDLYRVCQIADRLEVSVDWLLGRSDVMEILGKGKQIAWERNMHAQHKCLSPRR